MGSRIDKFVRKRKSVKADRSTEQGVAGWQVAMKAAGNAAGWKREGNSAMWNELGKQPDGSRVSGFTIDGFHPGMENPGKGHVTAYYDDYAPSGRYRGKRPTRRSGIEGIMPGKLTEEDKK
jgi:hypothetical protein